MAMETQDIIKRSATNPITPAPRARDYKAEVAKLIDVSSCVGCKACQVACSEWNDIRDDVGHCVGVYDNPAEGLPIRRGDYSVRQRHRRFPAGKLHRLRLLHCGVSV